MRRLGTFWCPGHLRPTDLDYMRQLDPAAVRIFEADSNKMKLVKQAAPFAALFPRIWSITEDENKIRADANPEAVGVEHAQFWAKRLDQWAKEGFVANREWTFVVGINEPRMWPEPGIDRKVNWNAWYTETMKRYDIVGRYNVAFLNKCKEYGMKASALNLSVGWPPNLHDEEPSYWAPFENVHEAIVKGNHVLTVHEYWFRSGPETSWGWHAGRFSHCPWKDVKIVIGECGIENMVDQARMQAEGLDRGWKGSVSSISYALQLKKYIDSCSTDSRFWVAFPFLTDYYQGTWKSQDTDGAHSDILNVFKSNTNAGILQLPDPTKMKPIEVPGGPVVTPPGPIVVEPLTKFVTWPFTGAEKKITQYWGANPANYAKFGLNGHNGLDMGCPQGTSIFSIADGKIVWVDEDKDYGRYIRVYHPQFKVCSFYAHLSSQSVKVGDLVKAGSEIGKSGNTGNSTGPHLHLEVRKMVNESTYETFDTGFGKRAQLDPFTFLKTRIVI